MPSKPLTPDRFYRPFTHRVAQSLRKPSTPEAIELLLNGAAADEAHSQIPKDMRAQDGIFFSGSILSLRAAEYLRPYATRGESVFDPACGAGDLLLAAARHLPLKEDVVNTLHYWGSLIGGADIHQEFVSTTKLRLALLAKARHHAHETELEIDESQLFPKIARRDYLANPTVSKEYNCVITNPPFGHRAVPKGCTWSTGKTQLAAIFLEKVLEQRSQPQLVIAILPDVLRSGTRYKKWRQQMAQFGSPSAPEIYGRFERRTDVDVFIVCYGPPLQIPSPTELTNSSSRDVSPRAYLTIDDVFSVKVGPVVPHRHTPSGPNVPYLTVGNATAKASITPKVKRKFSGTTIKPPFVAIRRTSNPADKQRLIWTLVTGQEAIAVENHLVVLKPRDEKQSSCELLVQTLEHSATAEHLNSTIRCRHLTVSAIKSIPLRDWNIE